MAYPKLLSTLMFILFNFICHNGVSAKIKFWEHSNFNGDSLSVSPNENDCVNVPGSWNDRISSIHVQAACLLVWEHGNCQGNALKLHTNHNHLGELGFNDVISSFKVCSGSSNGDGGGDKNGVARASLDAHNKYRRLHGAPDLQWDSNLQAAAQRHADYLAKTKKFEHSKNGNGENLAGVGGRTKEDAVRRAVTLWYNEINHYDFNHPGFKMNTGHFTQVVWKSSLRLGVGVAWDAARNWWIVCANYSPPGNFGGQFHQNVERRRV